MASFPLTSQVPVRHFFSSSIALHMRDLYLFIRYHRYHGNTRVENMAVSPGGDDSVYDAGRLSLFDLIVERSRAQNKVGN